MSNEKEFDPVAEGHKEARKNAKIDVEHSDSKPENITVNVKEAHKLAKDNYKEDVKNTTDAEMNPVKVSTSEVDIPEGAPVTDDPEVSNYTQGNEADSKDPEDKKDLPDDEKRQDTSKDSATPSPDEESTDGDNSGTDKEKAEEKAAVRKSTSKTARKK